MKASRNEKIENEIKNSLENRQECQRKKKKKSHPATDGRDDLRRREFGADFRSGVSRGLSDVIGEGDEIEGRDDCRVEGSCRVGNGGFGGIPFVTVVILLVVLIDG